MYVILTYSKNAVESAALGMGPKVDVKPDELVAIRSGGKSIEELTSRILVPMATPDLKFGKRTKLRSFQFKKMHPSIKLNYKKNGDHLS